MNPAAFIVLLRPAIRKAIPAASIETERLILAHAALETGWGNSEVFRDGHNAFNITRGPGDERPIIEAGDLEYTPAGKVRNIRQRFAAYRSLEESVEHYLKFINRQRYRPALEQLLAGDASFVVTLGAGDPDGPAPKGGYYTLPVHDYWRRFESVLRNVEVLTQQPKQA